jgi:hypothetical protein
MHGFLKRALLSLSVIGLCWIGAVWYWRATTRVPDGGDLALALLILPLTLLLSLWLLLKAYGKWQDSAAAAAAASAAAPAAATAPAAPPPALPQLDIVAAALHMPHGASPAELAAALAAQEARLDLDPELQDAEGFPILAGRADDVDTAALTDWLSHQASSQPLSLTQDQQRALALGGSVAHSLAQQAMAAPNDGVLQLAPLLPAAWLPGLRELAARWLLHNVVQAGWPQDRLALRVPAASLPVAALQDIAARSGEPAAPALTLLLACESAISAEAVEQQTAQGRLFTSRNPHGQIPSEGASGLLLQRAAASTAPDEAARLHATQAALQNGKPERPDAATLQALVGKVLQEAGIDAGQLALVASDTDHRAARMTELMGCLGQVCPELDTDSQLACTGAACGHTAAVATLAALALAQHHVLDQRSFALCLSNVDALHRAAVLVGPIPAAMATAPTLT